MSTGTRPLNRTGPRLRAWIRAGFIAARRGLGFGALMLAGAGLLLALAAPLLLALARPRAQPVLPTPRPRSRPPCRATAGPHPGQARPGTRSAAASS